MRVAIFAYSRQGCETAKRVLACLSRQECRPYTMERFEEKGFLSLEKPSQLFYGELFRWAEAMIFVGSCGIALRQIAPHVKDKKTDPAVICIDELGTFVIPLLSGHMGGANELAAGLAKTLNATAVITTATDINGKFSVDTWARKMGFVIHSMPLAKAVSAEILERDVSFSSDFPVTTQLPPGLTGETGKVGIYLTCTKREPYEKTLRLIPKVLHLGIGCRKGVTKETIAAAVDAVVKKYDLDFRAIKDAASIDLKAEEAGLLAFCREQSLPVQFYSGKELLSLKEEFTASDFVESVTGVDNVCERSARMKSDRILVRKTALNGVTVALGMENLEVRFE